MGTFKGMVCAAAIAALGVVGTGCEEDELVDDVDDTEFAAIDTNGDGVVNVTEWTVTFDTWDVDNDGYVEPTEYRLAGGYDALDVDRNALLTQAEWNSAMLAWDVDADGFLDADEMFF